ncbi:MAG: hypothetical protein ACO3CQ_00940 [Candidatus Nanopelagicaceae bacterium]
MSVAVVNIDLEKGTDFEATFNIFGPDNGPVSLSNYDGISKIRKHPTSVKSKSFDVEIIEVDKSVKISMGRTDTLDLSSGRNYFDVFLQDSNTGHTIKVLEGSIIVSDSISI